MTNSWARFGENWATFYSTLWSHCWHTNREHENAIFYLRMIFPRSFLTTSSIAWAAATFPTLNLRPTIPSTRQTCSTEPCPHTRSSTSRRAGQRPSSRIKEQCRSGLDPRLRRCVRPSWGGRCRPRATSVRRTRWDCRSTFHLDSGSVSRPAPFHPTPQIIYLIRISIIAYSLSTLVDGVESLYRPKR